MGFIKSLLSLAFLAVVAAGGYLYLSFNTIDPCKAAGLAIVRDTPQIIDQIAQLGPEYAMSMAAVRLLDPSSAQARQIAQGMADRIEREGDLKGCSALVFLRVISPERFHELVAKSVTS